MYFIQSQKALIFVLNKVRWKGLTNTLRDDPIFFYQDAGGYHQYIDYFVQGLLNMAFLLLLYLSLFA
jgi:hypothetical protein